jgi:uncharacterized protein (DUF1684 family)
MTTGTRTIDELDLLDWRRRVFELYRGIRASSDPEAAWLAWRDERDRLFATHPQSPLDPERRARFGGLRYCDYDPAMRALAAVVAVEPASLELATSTGEPCRFRRFAEARFALAGTTCTLPLFWLEGYGGGVFLPFADGTSGGTAYACRYLLDTVKGADLGGGPDGLVLDFNFAYNPSCAYNPAWTCPLASAGSRLGVAVEAGELVPGW